MFSNILKRKDVLEFVKEIFSWNYKGKIDNFNYQVDMSEEEMLLFTFYDALFKYEIIIDTNIYLDEYIEQVRKLFKKIGNFQDINIGIAKIIGKFCALKLNIKDKDMADSKKQILEYVYDRYIVNGYFFHGYSGVYKKQIEEYGLRPEEYQHFYSRFMEIDKTFKRCGFDDIINKNFFDKTVYFTDSFMMGCYYGANAPRYFSRLLSFKALDDESREAYFKGDYFASFSNLNRLMKEAGVSSTEKKYITRTCFEEWKVLQKNSSGIDILFIKRSLLGVNYLSDIDRIINSDEDLGQAIFKIMTSKSDDIPVDFYIDSKDIGFIEIPNYKIMFSLRNEQASYNNKNNMELLNNAYGQVSVLILVGSLLIALGVILTIVTISWGIR